MKTPRNRYPICWLTILLSSLLAGCVYSTVDLPKLPAIPVKPPTCPQAAPVKVCPPTESVAKIIPEDLPILDPIPKVIHLTIEPGKQEADEGGRKLIENYVAYRKWRKQYASRP